MGKPFPLHPKPARRARQVAAMSKSKLEARAIRELVLRVRCSEEERATWLRKWQVFLPQWTGRPFNGGDPEGARIDA